MFKKLFVIIPLALSIGALQVQAAALPIPGITPVQEKSQGQLIAQESIDLSYRYPVPAVSNVFRDNILLNLAYLSGKIKNAQEINWDKVRSPQTYEITLAPGEVFAFHEDVLPEFANKKIVTTNAHFNAAEGFLSDGVLYGDGVCHLASLINWTAQDAGLRVVSQVNHDFMAIPGVDRKYGTAIYYSPGEHGINQAQNLYVENTLEKTVRLVFVYNNNQLTLSVYK